MVLLGKKSAGTIYCRAKSYGVTPVPSMLETAYRIVSRPQNFFQVSIEIKYEKKQAEAELGQAQVKLEVIG